ncbi:MAG: hypothetical protein JSS63_01345 [Bacteroidetes bacterium]|nr:hypothetical protein [Bacteroidota bacterium]
MKLKEHGTVLLLKSLPKSEIEQIEKFISSPYFNSNKNIASYFSEIVKFHPLYEGENFEKEILYSRVYKDKAYNDSNYRWIMSEITKLIEKYLAQNEYDKDKLMQNFYLLQNHTQNHRASWIAKAITNNEKLLSEYPDKDYVFFFHKYIHYTHEMNLRYTFKNSIKASDLEFLYEKFQKAFISYINHFIIGIAYDYLNAGIIFSFYQKNGVNKKINEIIKILDFAKIAKSIEPQNEDSDTLNALIMILNMYLNFNDNAYYKEFRKFLNENTRKISREQLSGYYSKLISYCRLKIVNSIEEEFFRKELHGLCEDFIGKKYFIQEITRSLTPNLFRIALENSLELENYDYAENFLTKNIDAISIEKRNDVLNFGKALLCFYKGDYGNSLEYLSRTDGSLFAIDQKALRMLLFIEQKFYFECGTELKSFKKFLSTNKFLSPETMERWMNFTHIVSLLLDNYEKKNKPGKKLIRDLLSSKKQVYFHKWFLKKINGL